MKDDAGFNEAVASVRIVYIDHYLLPLSEYSSSLSFHAARLRLESSSHNAKLPVVRIFGSTPGGQKACLHLHGALPYMYLPVPEGLSSSGAVSLAEKLREALELAVRNVADGIHEAPVQNHRDQRPPVIASLTPVLRTSIYGYTRHPSLFLHLKAYNPRTIMHIMEVLGKGSLPPELSALNLQPFESHLPFHLQVLTDLSLVGMGYVNLKSCRFRFPLPQIDPNSKMSAAQGLTLPNVSRVFHEGMQAVREDLVWPFAMSRRSTSDLELDAFIDDVLNARKIPRAPGAEGPAAFVSKTLRILWEEERLRTGSTPAPKQEEPRRVNPGSECTDSFLREKLTALVAGQVPTSGPVASFTPSNKEPSPASEDQDGLSQSKHELSSIPSSFNDVFDYLDNAPNAVDHERLHEETAQDNIVDSDGEVIEKEDIATEWALIAQCSQSADEAKPMPPISSHGKEVKESSPPRKTRKASKLRRKSKRARQYSPLKLAEAPALSRPSAGKNVTEPQGEMSRHGSSVGNPSTMAPVLHGVQRGQSEVSLDDVHDLPEKGDNESSAESIAEADSMEIQVDHAGNKFEQAQNVLQRRNRKAFVPHLSQKRSSQPFASKNIGIHSQVVDPSKEHHIHRPLSSSVTVLPRKSKSSVEGTSLVATKEICAQAENIEKAKKMPEEHGQSLPSTPNDSGGVDHVYDSDEAMGIDPPPQPKTIITFSSQPWKSTPDPIAPSPPQSQPFNSGTDEMPIEQTQRENQDTVIESKEKSSDRVMVLSQTPEQKPIPRRPGSGRQPQESPRSDLSTPLPLTQTERMPGMSTGNSTKHSRRRPKHIPTLVRSQSRSTDNDILPGQVPSPLLESTKSKLGKSPKSPPVGASSISFPLTKTGEGTAEGKFQSRHRQHSGQMWHTGKEPVLPPTYVMPAKRPPSLSELRKTQVEHDVPSVIHTPAFYGNPKDAPLKPEIFSGVTFRIPVGGLQNRTPAVTCFRGADDGAVALESHLIPVRRPPSISELLAVNSECAKNSGPGGTQRVIIDSAGRQIRVDDKTPPGFESMSQDSVSALHPAADAHRVQRKGSRGGGRSDSDSDESAIEDSLDLSVPRESPAAKKRHVTSITDRPPSPKYDERCFYQDITSSQEYSDGRHASRMQSATKSPTAALHSNQNLTYVAIEILAACVGKNEPDPARNPILAICAVVVDSRQHVQYPSHLTLLQTSGRSRRLSPTSRIQACSSEEELLDGLVALISLSDPDIITGFETQTASIGFILERAATIGHSLPSLITRDADRDKVRPYNAAGQPNQEGAAARYMRHKGANVTVRGRHLLNLWRIVRSEVKLACYSAEGVALQLLHTRMPRHTPADLEGFLRSPKTAPRALSYLCRRTQLVVDIMNKLDVTGRTGELARVFGVDFMSVLTRGSQFRVESMLARVAHERGFVLLAAQKEQVFAQPAVESLPLVMEPMSALYVDPVIVLDFQSLYPSMIIAHNLCFSTMMGNINRVQTWGEPRPLGVVKGYKPPDISLFGRKGEENLFVAPNGELFVTAKERRGIVPQMLNEILTTRVMVKSALKAAGKDDPSLARLLNSRQFGLKMIANVTYGYASASFSGRMPCANLADAIVQCGRDALEKMVDFVDNELSEDTGASVVYGDTDSLFVRVPGATRAEAFDIGDRIVAKSLELFPSPIRLQLEKVYHPCVLQAKKRYVGYCYETRDQAVPTFDAKGIETVRRDSCELVQSTLERSIRVLFETRDISLVKSVVQRTWQRVLSNRLPLSAYIFRKEVKLGSYKDGHLPPAAIVATRAMARDPRAAPRYGERVPFVVIYAGASATLRDSVVAPEHLIASEREGLARLNATYYITKQIIPALDRVFALIGVRVASWFAEMPRTAFAPLGAQLKPSSAPGGGGAAARNSLYRYYASAKCTLCRGKTTRTRVCGGCTASEGLKRDSRFVLSMRVRRLERKICDMRTACTLCIDVSGADPVSVECTNLSCGIKLGLDASWLRLQSCRDALQDENFW